MSENINLLKFSLSSVSFKTAIEPAKVKSPQTFILHSLSVGFIAKDVCSFIKDSYPSYNYDIPLEELCFITGFLHDWNKIKEGDLEKKREDAIKIAKEILKKLGKSENLAEEIVDDLAPMAEGVPSRVELTPVWVGVKIGDMLMVSDIKGVEDVKFLMDSRSYRPVIEELRRRGFEIRTLSSTFRLFTLLASRDILEEVETSGILPLASYPNGLVYLSKAGSPRLKLSLILDVLSRRLSGNIEKKIDIAKKDIERCLDYKKLQEFSGKLFMAMRTNKEESKVVEEIIREADIEQTNSILHTHLCKPLNDVLGSIEDPQGRVEVIKRIFDDRINKYGHAIDLFIYLVVKGKMKKDFKVSNSWPDYIVDIIKLYKADPNQLLQNAIKVLSTSSSSGKDRTLMYFVRTSFGGDVDDDLPPVEGRPYNYCTVCGLPIYAEGSDVIRFVQYSSILGGKSEVFNPRGPAMGEIDSLIDSWASCKICIYEARILKQREIIDSPLFLFSFIPSISISLLDTISLGTVDMKKVDYLKAYIAMSEGTYWDVIGALGITYTPGSPHIIVDYLGSKTCVPRKKINDNILDKIPLELDVNRKSYAKLLAHSLPYLILNLGAPMALASSISDVFYTEENIIKVWSTVTSTWTDVKSNWALINLLLAYAIKFDVLTKICKGKGLDNCVGSLINEMDYYSSVSPSLSVIATGMGVGSVIEERDESFVRSLSKFMGTLNLILKEVDKMGEKISSLVDSIVQVLKEVVKDPKSKYDIVGFLRDGIDMLFMTTSLSKEDRVGLAVSSAVSSLKNKTTLNDTQEEQIYLALRDLFETIADIEEKNDRSLAIRIANSISNWIYLFYKHQSR